MATSDTFTGCTPSNDPQLSALAAMTAAEVYGEPDSATDSDLVARHVERTISALRALPPMQTLDDAITHLARYATDLAYDAERR